MSMYEEAKKRTNSEMYQNAHLSAWNHADQSYLFLFYVTHISVLKQIAMDQHQHTSLNPKTKIKK